MCTISRRLLVNLLVWAIWNPLYAQWLNAQVRVPPFDSGMPFVSWHSLPAGGIDTLILAHMRTYHVPGIAACVVKEGRVAWEGYYGFANLPRGVPVGPDNSFMLASVSKTVTGTALMRLWEQGRFRLDDSINAYLPFPVRNPRHPAVPITFRQLMCHVSSINDNWSMMPYFPGDTPLQLGWYLREYLTPGGSYYGSSNFLSVAPGVQAVYCNVAIASGSGSGCGRSCIGMWPRGEVGAGVPVVSISYGIAGPMVAAATLSLALNLLLTGVFILLVKGLLRSGAAPSIRKN